MKTYFRIVWPILALGFTAIAARAGEIPVDMSGVANEPWTYVGPNDFVIYNPTTFPTGAQNYGGVPFDIPSGPNNYWAGAAAANFGAGTVSVTIPVNVYGVTSAYTLLNTMWGWPGPTAYLTVTFTGSTGAVYTVPLIGNVNVRDYNQDGNTNSINGTTTVQAWSNGLGQRLDRQEYILPAAFATQTLVSVTLTDSGNEGNGTNGSRAILAALTVSTCRAVPMNSLTVTSGPIVYEPLYKLYAQEVVLTNTSTAAVTGPLFFILDSLPTGVDLLNRSAATTCLAPGSRFTEPLPTGYSLAPNTSEILVLWFYDPSAAAITYTPVTASSVGGAP